MQPMNNKSLLHFLFGQMEKLDSKEIDVSTAKAQAELAKQANNMLKYEIDRAKVQMQLTQHNAEYKTEIKLREIESKEF